MAATKAKKNPQVMKPEVPYPSVEEITAAIKRGDEMETAINSLNGEYANLLEKVGVLAQKVRESDPEVMAAMEARQQEVTRRLHGVIHRVTVVTEVAFYARHLAGMSLANRWEMLSAAIRALDHSEEWWNEDSGHDNSIEWWAIRCLEEYRRRLKHEAAIVNGMRR